MSESAPYRLMALVRRESRHDAWRHINPMLSRAFSLAIVGNLVFEPDDFGKIVKDFRGSYWMGPDSEPWYTEAVKSGNESAVISMERWLGRQPFLFEGKRIHVGEQIRWNGQWVICTSIASDSFNAKVNEEGEKKRVITIQREELEAYTQAQKLEVAEREKALEEASRADPVDLIPFDEHLTKEVGFYHGSSTTGWAKAYGTDYARAWKEWNDGNMMGHYLNEIDATKRSGRRSSSEPAAIRKRWPWPKVEQHLFRYLRRLRKLPMKDRNASTEGTA